MKVILVVKRTRLETADAAASQLVEDGHPSVSGWRGAHDRHHESLKRVREALQGVDFRTVWSPYESFDTDGADLVVVVGGDGTFLAASHSVNGIPMLGVNSDPSSSRGFFCGTDARRFEEELHRAIRGSSRRAVLQRMEVSVDGVMRSKRVLNEALVCHPHPAATSRFAVSFGSAETADGWDAHMSSGIWVGTPAGSTGAVRSAGGDVLPLESDLVQFVSRETVHGEVRKMVTRGTIRVRVKTDAAAVYMDGPFRKAGMRLGQTVDLRLSNESLTVLGLDGRR